MAAEAPAARVAVVGHVHGAEPDVVDPADVPARMMDPGPARLREGEDVMVAAVHRVHEGDDVGAVGQAQAEIARIERDRARSTSVVNISMCESRRGRTIGALARTGAPATPSGDDDQVPDVLWSGDTFAATLTSTSTPAGIAQPEAVAREARGRIEDLGAVRFRRALSCGRSSAVAAERHMVQPLARALDHGAPALVVPEGRAPAYRRPAHVEPEAP